MLAEILAKGKNILPSNTTQDDKGLDRQSYQFSYSRITHSWVTISGVNARTEGGAGAAFEGELSTKPFQ
jgi:hypothetical protein